MTNKRIIKKNILGFTLLEILVVITIFGLLGILISQAVLLTIGGTKKSEGLIKVRENLDYAMGVIDRQLRNANSIPTCPNTDTTILSYTDQNGNASSFSCVNVGSGSGYVASGSATLTDSSIDISTCSISCTTDQTNPPVVNINIVGSDKNATGAQKATVTISSQVSLRSY